MSTAATFPDSPSGLAQRLVLPSVDQMLLWAIIILSPFQDTALRDTPLKLFGSSPAVLPVIMLASLALAKSIVRPRLRIDRALLIAIAYAAIVCAAHLLTFEPGLDMVQWRPLRSFGLMTALILFMVSGVDYRNTRGLRIAIYLSFVLTIVGVIVDALLGATSINPLQVTLNTSGRPRGFSTEASTLSIQIVCIGMLLTHYLEKRWQKVLAGTMTVGLLVYSQSKGGLIVLLLCALVLVLSRSRASLASKILVAVLISPVLVIGGVLVASMFSNLIQLNETSTIATRISMTVFSFTTVLHNPFGVGFTGFFPTLPKYLPGAIWTVHSWFSIPLGFGEVSEYLAPPFQDADCKSLFLDFFVFFGIPFAVLFFHFSVRFLRRLFRSGCFALFIGVLFVLAAMLTYYSTLNAYTAPLIIGVALYEVRRREAALRL